MDEVKRKHNDKRYDWWSAEGDHKLINISYPSKRDIAIANQWHDYFLWKPISENVYSISLTGVCANARAKDWHKFAFYKVYFDCFRTPFAGWSRDVERFSDALIHEDPVGYTILYERAVDTPFSKELGVLQTECEALVEQMWSYCTDLEKTENKLHSFLPFGKTSIRQKKEETERIVLQLCDQIDQLFARVNEIRALVLGG